MFLVTLPTREASTLSQPSGDERSREERRRRPATPE
jgi:hypothetical protein